MRLVARPKLARVPSCFRRALSARQDNNARLGVIAALSFSLQAFCSVLGPYQANPSSRQWHTGHVSCRFYITLRICDIYRTRQLTSGKTSYRESAESARSLFGAAHLELFALQIESVRLGRELFLFLLSRLDAAGCHSACISLSMGGHDEPWDLRLTRLST